MKVYPFYLILLLLSGCQGTTVSQTSPTPTEKPSVSESQLSLYNAILEQANPKGKTLWKIKSVKTTYSPDRKLAYLEDVTGNFWANEELAIYLSGSKGEVVGDGQVIILTDNVVIKDVRSDTVITADKLTWYPQQSLLIIEDNLLGQHAQFNVTATMAKYHSDTQQLELIGKVIGNSVENPIQFTSDQLLWKISEQTILVNSPVEIVRYDEAEIVTEKVVAQQLEVDLASPQAKFRGNVELVSVNPPIQIASNSIIWNYQEGSIISDQPVKLVHNRENITLKANRGEVDLNQEIAYLKDGVEGNNPRRQADLYASELVWSINTQIVEAKGNVIYQQVEPYMHLTGERAVGNIQENNIVVSGDRQNQIVTDIIPE